MTKEEIMEAAGRCPDAADKPMDLGCIHCPLDKLNGYRKCAAEFANYIRTKKEPAQAATCTDSEVRISPNISTSDNTTETSRCQGLSGISGLGCLESALDEWLGLGQEAEIVSVRADQTDSELVFEHEGEKYIMAFGRYEE